jgi:hypothetical protein
MYEQKPCIVFSRTTTEATRHFFLKSMNLFRPISSSQYCTHLKSSLMYLFKEWRRRKQVGISEQRRKAEDHEIIYWSRVTTVAT